MTVPILLHPEDIALLVAEHAMKLVTPPSQVVIVIVSDTHPDRDFTAFRSNLLAGSADLPRVLREAADKLERALPNVGKA